MDALPDRPKLLSSSFPLFDSSQKILYTPVSGDILRRPKRPLTDFLAGSTWHKESLTFGKT